MSTGNTLAEYLVSLGVKVDEAGFQKVKSTLFTTKATVIGITAALSAMTIGIAKASISLRESQQKFEDMAKSGNKSADAIAKQEVALKIMGKTLKEINKNERLKKTFNELKAVGDAIGMPKAGEGAQQLDAIITEFQKLKITSTYVMQWINKEFLDKLAFPLQEFRKEMETIRKNLTLNLPKISATIGKFLAGFMQLMLSGIRGVKSLGEYISGLPPIVHTAMIAFAGMWGVLKASPIFWILGGLMSLLLLLDDFQTYKAGGKNAFGFLWDLMDKEGGIAGAIAESVGNMGFENVGELAGEFMKNLYTWLFGEINKSISTDKLQEWALNFDGIAGSIVTNLISAFEAFDIGSFAGQATAAISGMISSLFDVIFGREAKFDLDQYGQPDNYRPKMDGLLKLANDLGSRMLFSLAEETGKIPWDEMGEQVSVFANKLVSGLSGAVTTFFSDGGSFDGLVDAAKAIGDGAVGVLVGAIKKFELGENIESVLSAGKTIIDKVMEAIFGKPAVMGIPQNGRDVIELEPAKKGIFDSVEQWVKDISKEIVTKITSVDWEISGDQIGTMFTNLFIKIGEYFKNKSEADENIFTDVVGVAKSIVGGILSALSGFFSTADPVEIADSIGDFIDGLMVMFTKAFLDENNQVTDIGTQIGQALGDAIKFTGDLILRIAQRLADSFGADGVGAKFVSVGRQIAEDISNGIMEGLNDVAGKIFFGEQGWAERKQKSKLREASRAGKVVFEDESGGVISPKDVNKFIEENPEAAQAAFDQQFDWQAEKTEVEAGFGDRYVDPLKKWGHSGDIKDGFKGTKVEDWQKAYGIFMLPWSKEKTELDKRIRGVEYGRDTQDPEEYKERLEYLLAYIEAYKQGKVGDDLFGAGNQEIEVTPKLPDDAQTTLQSQFDKLGITLKVTPEVMAEGLPGNAVGGRYNTPQLTSISETGQTEYIIPMNRPERAKGLILSMLSEMGSGAKDILKTFGVKSGGGLSGMENRLAMAGAYPTGGGGSVKSNSDNTVTSNPVINVYGSSDPVLTGRVAYEASEQTLVRHLRGVLGS